MQRCKKLLLWTFLLSMIVGGLFWPAHGTHECHWDEFDPDGPWVCPEHEEGEGVDDLPDESGDDPATDEGSGGDSGASEGSADNNSTENTDSSSGNNTPNDNQDTANEGEVPNIVLGSSDDLPPYIEGELLIQFTSEQSQASIDQLLRDLNANILRFFVEFNMYHVQLTDSVDTLSALAACQSLGIALCELNGVWSLFSSTPNDESFPLQWPLQTGEMTGGLGIDQAWSKGFINSREITVALIDSGVDLLHEDIFENLIVGGFDAVHRDGEPEDNIGHGTLIASLIGALGNNGIGIAGVNWEASLIVFKAADNLNLVDRTIRNISSLIQTGSFGTMAWADFIDAMERVVQLHEAGRPIDMINLSAGGAFSEMLQGVIQRITALGILIFTAAGNGSPGWSVEGKPVYPCNNPDDHIICIGSINRRGELSSFSNFGTEHVDLAAPGENVVGLMPEEVRGSGTLLESSDTVLLASDLVRANGTSFSTAYTTGLAALLWSVCPELKPLELKQLILESTKLSPFLVSKVRTGGYLHWPSQLPESCR